MKAWVVKETNDKIWVMIQVTMLTVQSEIRPLLNKLRANFDDLNILQDSNQWMEYKHEILILKACEIYKHRWFTVLSEAEAMWLFSRYLMLIQRAMHLVQE